MYKVVEYIRDEPRRVGRHGFLGKGDIVSLTPSEWNGASTSGNFKFVKDSPHPITKKSAIPDPSKVSNLPVSPVEQEDADATAFQDVDLGEMEHGELVALAGSLNVDISHCETDEAIRGVLAGELAEDENTDEATLEAQLSEMDTNQLRHLADEWGVDYKENTRDKTLRKRLLEANASAEEEEGDEEPEGGEEDDSEE